MAKKLIEVDAPEGYEVHEVHVASSEGDFDFQEAGFRIIEAPQAGAVSDKAIADLVRLKMSSGNSVPVDRCFITAGELSARLSQQPAPQAGVDAVKLLALIDIGLKFCLANSDFSGCRRDIKKVQADVDALTALLSQQPAPEVEPDMARINRFINFGATEQPPLVDRVREAMTPRQRKQPYRNAVMVANELMDTYPDDTRLDDIHEVTEAVRVVLAEGGE